MCLSCARAMIFLGRQCLVLAMKLMIEKPILGQLTQGSIFSAASAENYKKVPVWGICITARCDVAHETKTSVFNYVPIVRYEDWLLVDGSKIIIDKIYNAVRGKAKEIAGSNLKCNA